MKTVVLIKSAVAVAALAAAGSALAIPTLSKNVPVAGSFQAASNVSFSQTVTFTVLPKTTGVSISVIALWVGNPSKNAQSFAATLTKNGGGYTYTLPTLKQTPNVKSTGGTTLLTGTPGNLAAGTYTLTMTGKLRSSASPTNVSYKVSALSPIPEPETYALMLAGLGSLAFIARRRKSV
jgi:hypothetical protein